METRRLIEQVKRNIERFPPDFMFQLTRDEAAAGPDLRGASTTDGPTLAAEAPGRLHSARARRVGRIGDRARCVDSAQDHGGARVPARLVCAETDHPGGDAASAIARGGGSHLGIY